MRYFGSRTHRSSSTLLVVAVLIAAVSQSLAAKAVSGRQGQFADGSFVSATVDGRAFTHVLSAGESAPDARDALVAIIDASDEFMADENATVPPIFEVDDVVYEVLTESGSELDRLTACETDANYTTSGAHFPAGKAQALFRVPTAIAGDGSFDLRLDMEFGPDVHLNIPTGPNLVDTIMTDLIGLGFTVELVEPGFSTAVGGTDLQITKTGDQFLSLRVESDDSSIVRTCASLRDKPSLELPILSRYAVGALLAGLLLAGVAMIRRKMAAPH